MEEYNITKDVFGYMVEKFLKDKEKPLLKLVNKEYRHKYKNSINIKSIIKNGNLGTLNYIKIDKWTPKFIRYAIQYGKWDIVEWLSNLSINLKDKPSKYQIDTMNKIINSNIPHLSKSIDINNSYLFLFLFRIFDEPDKAFDNMAKNGNLYGIKWLHNFLQTGYDIKECSWKETVFINAARRGHINILQWISEVTTIRYGDKVMAAAARFGNLDNMKWLKSIGCNVSSYALEEAGRYGNIENMKWLISIGCQWTDRAFTRAVKNGNIHNLKWILLQSASENDGCPMSSVSFAEAIREDNLTLATYLKTEFGCPMDIYSYHVAIRKENAKAIKYLHSTGCPFDINNIHIFEGTSYKNNLNVFQSLHEIGYKYPNNIISIYLGVVRWNYKIDVIKYLYGIGYPILDSTITFAARYCTLDDMKWMYSVSEHKVISEFALEYAVLEDRDINMMRWLVVDCKCGVSKFCYDEASKRNNMELVNLFKQYM
ncbi:Ankyrin-repeat protein [Orpheovirus IHUMI-LCC2]|uniref:Ankyrin-repeat protein n=1 Tax=Orpheovirus IHUMI-LCC2 TaxID=2023057 RepID=A0A2I2L4X8_9VIRU|nr:Ankyrin-repeat protein [Orpheovirus IHUMI-LCC2]SNW62576.1 Ankyrin-repeat protein [Orpheovirus IHUMI-LCC2]